MKGDGIYRCANCGLEGERDDFVPAADLGQRLDPGGIYSDVECPSCGALAFPVPAEPAVRRGEPVVVEVDPASVQKAVAAVEGAYSGIEASAVRFVLDGLGVTDLRELHELVLAGRVTLDAPGPVDRLSGQWYEELRPLTPSPFLLVMVVTNPSPSIGEAEVREAGEFARLAAVRLRRRAHAEDH